MKKLLAQWKKQDTTTQLTDLFLGLLFGLLPLVLHNGFFDVVETKALFFGILCALWLLCLLWLSVPGLSTLPLPLTRGEGCLLLFWGIYVLSSLLGGAFAGTILAPDNRWQGLLTVLLYALMTPYLRRSGIGPLGLGGLLLGMGLTALLGTANFLGADPLHTLAGLSVFDRGRFLAAIGNINFYGAYLTLTWPVCVLLFCCAGSKGLRLAAGMLILPGLWAAMASRSESTVLGLTAALVLLPLILRSRTDALGRALWLWPGLAVGMLAFSLLARQAGCAGFSALTEFLLRPAVMVCWTLLGLGAYALARKSPRGYGLGLGALFVLALLFVLLANTLLPRDSLGRLGEYVLLDADWGTDRGLIWRRCFEMYKEMPLWQKLIGGGSGCLARWDNGRIFPDAVVDTAHNEYLHYLLTSGLLGLGAYLGFLGFCLSRGFRSTSAVKLALLAGVCAYGVQAAVNIAQPATTPLFFAMAALLTGPDP